MTKSLKVIDCTFRDGGYYNDWDFEPRTVQRYLRAMDAAGVDYIEIGFRAYASEAKYMGPFAYSPEWYFKEFELPHRAKIGVMANAKDLINLGSPDSQRMKDLFRPSGMTPVKLVRIASHFSEVDAVAPFVAKLKSLGYAVGFNLMQSAGRPESELKAVGLKIASWGSVDSLYFADSLGNMTPDEVRSTVTALKTGWKGDLGIHAHDNKGLALINTLTAIECGVTWVDSTVLGMGRGAGNTRTEHLLIELESRPEYQGRFSSKEIYPLVLEDFEPLKAKYGWGSNLLYYLAANSGIHPTYIQEMMGECVGAPERLLRGVEVLQQVPSKSYSPANLQSALNGPSEGFSGTTSAQSHLRGRDVLLLASGKQAVAHRRGIGTFIDSHKPYTISLNFDPPIPDKFVDAFATCNTSRVVTAWDRISKLTRPVIMPKAALEKNVINPDSKHDIIDYGINVTPGGFCALDAGAEIPASLVAPYAMAFSVAGGAKTIYLAGFDGFQLDDPRQSEMVRLIELFKGVYPDTKLVSLTPTSYPVSMSSVYAETELA